MAVNHEIDLHTLDMPDSGAPPVLSETHRAFIDGIEICAERFPDDEERRVNCFAEVVSSTIGRRPSKRTGTAIPADTTESRKRGSAHAHAAIRAKRAAEKAAKEQAEREKAEREKAEAEARAAS